MAFVMISICRKDGDDHGDNNDDDGDDGKNNFSHEDVSHIYTTEAAISKLSYHSYISFFHYDYLFDLAVAITYK